MSGSPYPIGSTVTMTSTAFTNATTGQPFDPTTVTLRYKDPNGAETVIAMASLVRSGVGVYSYDVVVGSSGCWSFAFEGPGNCAVRGPDGQTLVSSSRLVAG